MAELEKQGAAQLGDAQLTKTIVGKTVRVRNTVTGHVYEILYGAGGQRLVTSENGAALEPSAVGQLTSRAQAAYEIRMGRSSPTSAVSRSRSPSISWAASIGQRAATSTASRTTK